MQRRNFLQSLLALSGIPAVVSGNTITMHAHISVLIQESPLAGFQYHEGEDVWPRLKIGDALKLVREANNRHDRQAVRVVWRGHRLGYVPRHENTAVSQMLDRGQHLTARITKLNDEAASWGRLFMEIVAD